MKHKLSNRANFIKSDLLEEVIKQEKKYDILLSNPPYIKDEVINTLMEDVKIMNHILLWSGGNDGLNFYRRIINDSNKF